MGWSQQLAEDEMKEAQHGQGFSGAKGRRWAGRGDCGQRDGYVLRRLSETKAAVKES